MDVQQVHPAAVAEVDGREVAAEKRCHEGAHQRDALRVLVLSGMVLRKARNLISCETLIGPSVMNQSHEQTSTR